MFLNELRRACRVHLRAPGFTIAAVLTLGLGVAGTLTVFTHLDNLVLHPIPGVADAGRLALVNTTSAMRDDLSLSYPNVVDLRAALPPEIEGLAAYRLVALNLRVGGAAPERAWAMAVTGNYFEVLGISPALGRTFGRGEDGAAGTAPVVVITHRYWQRRFRSDPGVVGRNVIVNGTSFTIVGVTPAGFSGGMAMLAPDLFVPIVMQRAVMAGDRLAQRSDLWLTGLARLRKDVSIDRARASLAVSATRLEAYADNQGRGLTIASLWNAPGTTSRAIGLVMAVAMVMAILLLLVACANVANLLLTRVLGRQRETSIRIALGAGRWRLVQRCVAEHVWLVAGGCLVGIALAAWTLSLSALPPTTLPLSLSPRLTPGIVVFCAGVFAVTTLLISLAPAVQGSRLGLVSMLTTATPATGTRAYLRSGLVVVQVAFSLVLLISATLFLRAMHAAQQVDPGFSLRQGILASLDLRADGYDDARARVFYREIMPALAAVPGVENVALASFVPLGMEGTSDSFARIDGYHPAPNEEISIFRNHVSPGYFSTMGITRRAGRVFTDADIDGTEDVVVVNETVARKYFGGRDPVGGRIHIGPRSFTVVGVVADGKYFDLSAPTLALAYFPIDQWLPSQTVVHVRTSGDPAAIVSAVTRATQALAPNLPLFNVRTLSEHLELSSYAQRSAATMLGVMGAVALLLAGVGLGGVVGQSATRRVREIGIRMALGANRRRVCLLIVSQGLRLVVLGVIAGLAMTLPTTRLFASLLVGIASLDAWSYTTGIVAIMLIGGVACYLPARRASLVEPATALRME